MTTGTPASGPPGLVVGLLGAESTGKTVLSLDLRAALSAGGVLPAAAIAVVPEFLREFCDLHRRTPRADEQLGIAVEQTRRIDTAAATHALVIADTTALMTAVYHEQVFGDPGLYDLAEAAHLRVDLGLLTALDLPWRADGLQRDGPQVREPVDARLRAALERIGRPYAVVHGQGVARVEAALRAVRRQLGEGRSTCRTADRGAGTGTAGSLRTGWRHVCERCDDPACERRGAASARRACSPAADLSAAPPTPATDDRAA